MIDWKDITREDNIRVLMVDPHNLDVIRGELSGVLLDGCSITQGYNTDTRISGKIKALESNYVPGSWIRIIHEVAAEQYREELGTFVVTKPSDSWGTGAHTTEYELQSTLWALSKDLCPYHYSINAGAFALDAFDRICQVTGHDFVHLPGTHNTRYSTAKVYEMGDNFLTMLFDICDASNNRLDVDGHGRITIGPYVSPQYRTPSWTLDADDPRTLVLSDAITRDSSEADAAGRSIVTYSNNDVEIYATADAPSTSPYSYAQRGYTYAALHQVNDMAPATRTRAQELAQEYLKTDASSTVEWKVSALYFPCHEGETLDFILDGVKHTCLIKSVDPINLQNMTLTLTLKELNNG